MNDDDLAATCIADEAANQPYEGKVSVGVVILNRMALKYQSDGTVTGTVLKKFQFSGFWFDMINGKYTQTSFSPADAEAKAEKLFAKFSAQPIWNDCQRAWTDACRWTNKEPLSFTPGPQFQKLNTNTVLYLNPKISSAAWATPDKLDAVIYDHSFYHA